MDDKMLSSCFPNVCSPQGQGHVREILGTYQKWKVQPSQTRDGCAIVEITIPPGIGIPSHRHSHEDETFCVIEGTITFFGDDLNETNVIIDAGGIFYGPRQRFHAFRNQGPETARLLVFVTPGAQSEALFSELEHLSACQGRPVDATQVVEACSRYGILFN